MLQLEKQWLKQDLVVVDEVGYIPYSPECAQLFFRFMAARYERGSCIVTSNLYGRRATDFFKNHILEPECSIIEVIVKLQPVRCITGDVVKTNIVIIIVEVPFAIFIIIIVHQNPAIAFAELFVFLGLVAVILDVIILYEVIFTTG